MSEAKRDYQREYMWKLRAGKATVKPKPEWKPTKRMVDQVRYWASTLSWLGRKMIEGLGLSNEAEALRRCMAYLDERDKPKPSEPDYCSFCLQPASDERALVGNYRYNLICETCANEAIVVFAERRKRR